jgi:hypothetical protein
MALQYLYIGKSFEIENNNKYELFQVKPKYSLFANRFYSI